MKKGFTLVELSIVLVIIGLLIGGILAAQSMIGTAKIQGVVRQLQQYDVAVANFQTKYNQLPGDSNLFNPSGNNNGQIECCNGELGYFWHDLSLGVGLENSQGANYPSFNPLSDPTTTSNCPIFNLDQNKAGQPCLYGIYIDAVTINGFTSAGPKNYYQYDYSSGVFLSGSFARNVIKSGDALAIDLKIDDGKPMSGKVLGDAGGVTGECWVNNATINILQKMVIINVKCILKWV